ncbi:MAG: hypothetical protein SF029_00425 [bacterium]|nr:hypothetical protein [bacterium]
MPDLELNRPLVEVLRQRGELTDERIEAAFASVPRYVFLPNIPLEIVNSDTSIDVTYDNQGETICSSASPSAVSYVLRQLEPYAGCNILEIGTGTGYSAALIRQLVGENGVVTTLELDREAAKIAEHNLLRAGISGVTVVNTDGSMGYAPRAAYDRIVATVGLWDVPPVWLRQLRSNGRLVVPLWLDGLQVSTSFTFQPDGTLLSTKNMPTAFVYLRGALAGPNVRKRIGSTALVLLADHADQIDSAAMSTLLSDDADRCHLGVALDSEEYWYGFLPYLMLRETEKDIFALYYVADGQRAFGIEGQGFAFFTPGSAVFVPYYALGETHCFASVDSFLTVEQHVQDWEKVGRPGIDCLRVRLIPKSMGRPENAVGKLYERRDHYVQVWQEVPSDDDQQADAKQRAEENLAG